MQSYTCIAWNPEHYDITKQPIRPYQLRKQSKHYPDRHPRLYCVALRIDCMSTKAPPQLWKVEMVTKQLDPPETPPEVIARLSLRHTYMVPKAAMDFAGPPYFGGKDDQLVVCAEKGRPSLPLADG